VGHGYFWVNAFFVGINVIGLLLNMWLYYIDINDNNGVLDKAYDVEVAKSEKDNNSEAVTNSDKKYD